jgi:hypothetical protein
VRRSIHLLPFKKPDLPRRNDGSAAADKIMRRDYHFFSHGRRPSGRVTVNKMVHFGSPDRINIS